MPIGRALIVCGLLAWCAVIGLAAGLPAFALHASAGEQAPAAATGFVGSKACERCHADISARWAKTRMANVVRDPKQHPEAFIPDFSIPDPLVTFTKEDVSFIYGSKWKQRYFTKGGRRLLSARSAVGRDAQTLAPVLRRGQHRLVGPALSRGQSEAADRTDVRWLPLR